MFEEQQNTGKSASLAEKYANVLGQLSEESDGRAQAEHALEVERLTREEIIRAEVARQVAEERKRIEAEVEAKYVDKEKALDKRSQELDQRETEMTQKMDVLVQNIENLVNKRLAEVRSRAERTALGHLAEMFETYLQAFMAVMDKGSDKGQELLEKYRKAAQETQEALKEDIKEKLDKAEAKNKAKTDHIASLVRMIFTQKRERIVFTPEQRETLYERVKTSLNLTQEEKDKFDSCLTFIKDYREREEMMRLLKQKGKKGGHGRNKLPENLPRLIDQVIWPDCYKGHEDEYDVIGKDVQEFVLPAPARYVVQPVVRPIIRRKDNPGGPTEQAPCFEGLFWKSYVTPELIGKMENDKYVLPQPFNRQIKKMTQDGLPVKAATVNDWHEGICELIEPLFELQKERVFGSALLAADGSPFPIINNEKHKTVGHYMIQYRSLETGIPIFLINTKGKCGRSKEDIMDNLKDWKGNGFMCDAYSGYDWLKKIVGIRLCRCAAHARRMSDRALKENALFAQINLLFFQDINMVEEIIKKEKMTGAEKVTFRKETAGPIWETFKLWAASAIMDVPKDSLIYKALNYLLRNYDELTNYMDIPEMPLDNNDTERLIRDMVMGKKSYLFCRDLDACKRAAMMYSLFGACKVLGKNPERWLVYVLHHIKTTPKDKLYTLLPEFWEDINEQ